MVLEAAQQTPVAAGCQVAMNMYGQNNITEHKLLIWSRDFQSTTHIKAN